jgi:hypothetical protein
MKDNLLFTGIPETADETTEVAVKNFIHNQLKIDENMLLIVSVRGTMAVHALLKRIMGPSGGGLYSTPLIYSLS